eukprot:scaffold476495_cov29-Prasinocladus_malaysianus.AAC.1
MWPHSPSLWEPERKVALLLGQHPAAEPSLAAKVAHEGLEAVDPVVVARDGEALGALVPPQGPAGPAGGVTALVL